MAEELQYVELNKAKIDQGVLQKFDCGHPDFNEYLVNEASECAVNGEGVTYVLVSKGEYESGNITTVFAFATIQAAALYFEKEEKTYSVSAAEIKYFAISKYFQKSTAYLLDPDKYFSTIYFEWFLEELFELSTKTVGFQVIFLRANENGEKLYRRKHFVDAEEYIIANTDDDPLGKCIPMILTIQDNMYSIFGVE